MFGSTDMRTTGTLKANVSHNEHRLSMFNTNKPIVDYNSWIESPKGLRLAASLDKDVVLAEGYKEYDTGRTYLVKLGDWRKNKDDEVELDGIGGVNIVVKADVHRSGKLPCII